MRQDQSKRAEVEHHRAVAADPVRSIQPATEGQPESAPPQDILASRSSSSSLSPWLALHIGGVRTQGVIPASQIPAHLISQIERNVISRISGIPHAAAVDRMPPRFPTRMKRRKAGCNPVIRIMPLFWADVINPSQHRTYGEAIADEDDRKGSR